MPQTPRSERRRPQPAQSGPPSLPCLLCGGKPSLACAWLPGDQQSLQAPSGKVRAAVYALCGTCRQRPDVLVQVERRIARELRTLTTPAGVN
jgi:hypothetical protein